MGQIIQYASEKPMDTLEIRIYKGQNAELNLFNDEGDNYNYEKGNYTIIPFKWNEKSQSLTIGAMQGSYQGSLKKRVFHIVYVSESHGIGVSESLERKEVIYNGESKIIIGKQRSY